MIGTAGDSSAVPASIDYGETPTGQLALVDLPLLERAEGVDGCADVDAFKAARPDVKLGWSDDGLKAMLRLDQHPVAIYDFAARRGWCRSGFPPRTGTGWSDFGHRWEDEALDLFR